jgi:hypothetical protein
MTRLGRLSGMSLVAAVVPALAAAQVPDRHPRIELGVHGGSFLQDDRPLAAGPRLVVNFDDRTALDVTADLQTLGPAGPSFEIKHDLVMARLRRAVHPLSRGDVYVTVGGGLRRVVIRVPPVTLPSGTGVPGDEASETLPVASAGAGVQFQVTPIVRVFAESDVVFTDEFFGRAMAGVAVSIGRARRPDDRYALADPIRDGTMLGAKIGAAGGAGLGIFAALIVCALDDCSDGLLVGTLMTGIGTGIGAVTGAMIDSFREARSGTVRRPAIGGVVRW